MLPDLDGDLLILDGALFLPLEELDYMPAEVAFEGLAYFTWLESKDGAGEIFGKSLP